MDITRNFSNSQGQEFPFLVYHIYVDNRLSALVTREMTTLLVGPETFTYTGIQLFRVLRDDENPANGLHPKDPNGTQTIESHVSYGSYILSQYISTCADYISAVNWAHKDQNKTLTKRIAVIDANVLRSRNIKMTDLTKYNAYLGQKAYNYANCYNEVLVEGFIPSEAITNIKLICLSKPIEYQ